MQTLLKQIYEDSTERINMLKAIKPEKQKQQFNFSCVLDWDDENIECEVEYEQGGEYFVDNIKVDFHEFDMWCIDKYGDDYNLDNELWWGNCNDDLEDYILEAKSDEFSK